MNLVVHRFEWTPAYAVTVARDRAGLTQEELAEALAERTGKPWSQATVSKLEHGHRTVDWRLLVHLEAIFDRPLDWFVHGPGDDDGEYSAIPGQLKPMLKPAA